MSDTTCPRCGGPMFRDACVDPHCEIEGWRKAFDTLTGEYMACVCARDTALRALERARNDIAKLKLELCGHYKHMCHREAPK